VERGHVAQRQLNQLEFAVHASMYGKVWLQDVASGAAGGFIGRQPVTLKSTLKLLEIRLL
jgi:hypothetical protein